MKAAVYEGPRNVTVKDVPDATIEHPCDILVRITSTDICGSDLHMYEGRTSLETGRSMGHENLGEVVEISSAVSKVKVGDHVVLPFNVASGYCKQGERGLTNYCLTMRPERALARAAYGFAEMGPYQGGQAEYLRVPCGDFNALRLGEDAVERQKDYVMLADVFPTAPRPRRRTRSRAQAQLGIHAHSQAAAPAWSGASWSCAPKPRGRAGRDTR